jgi:hypothetical protein
MLVSVEVDVSGSLPAAADTASNAGVGELTPNMPACVALESPDKVAESTVLSAS